ncbi:MAG: phosphoribosyltransferase [Lachnospiraceae bacterium]|nr:phosphoribosyltransferase [Lachnospiraceae bacterium]
MEGYKKIASKSYPNIVLRVIPGHFVTANSHINYYIDMSGMKARQNEADAVAAALSEHYLSTTVVDTIVCMDGCEVIGAYLANHLTQVGTISMNAHKTIYITTPEFNTNGQLIFRENIQPMIKDKHILVLLASATTGKTVSQAIDVIQYYGGTVTGVSAIFSAASKVYDHPIHALFTTADLPDYQTHTPANCTMCKAGKPVDAIANGFGYSRL